MNWYYVDGGQQAGPVDDAQLEQLVLSGKIQAETLVWHEGMAAWTPYRQVAPVATAAAPAGAPPVSGPVPAPSGSVVCGECGRAFSPAEVIRYGDKWVCAECKPIFFQRVREGAAQGGAGLGGATQADLLARDYEVDVGGCLTQSWEVFKSRAGLMIGATVLVYLALIAINFIPYASFVLSLIFTGPLTGGLWLFYLKCIRDQPANVGDAFSGFGPRFWQLLLTYLIPGLIAVAVMAGLVAMVLPAVFFGARRGGSGFNWMLLLPVVFLVFVALVIMIYLNVCWMFALPLAGEKGLKFWPALELSRRVVNKHWWMTFLLVFVAGILAGAGALACLVGVLVTGPVAFGALASHYQRVFGDLNPEPSP